MSACPTHQQLEQFANGRLSDFDRSAVDTHVQTCVQCRQTMSTLSQADTATRIWNVRPKEAAPAAGFDELPAELREHPRYHVLELLAVGGMGAVYKAEHKLLERTVVLKVIRQDVLSRPELVQRFLREAKIAASMSHPNIVTLYEAEQLGPAYFLVMEYLAGTDLEDIIEERGPLPVAEACAWIRQAAIGLQYIHERGLVHRDIKPSNLFLVSGGVVSGGAADAPSATHDSTTQRKLTHHSTTHQIKILDLGLAVLRSGERSSSGLTEKGQILGTIDYMAPEQWEDSRGVDIRADIYSLGCTLYHLLAGKPPFDASQYSSMMRQMWAHAQAPVPPLSQARADVPPDVVAVLDRMLAKKPGDRYATPAEVVAALEPHAGAIAEHGSSAIRRLDGAKTTGAITTTRSTAISRLLPPRLRNKRPLLAFCASLLLLAGAAALFFWRGPSPAVTAQRESIKVGILHSRTGTMAISEKSVIDATLFAIEELNAKGGVLGCKVEAIVEDGASDAPTFARKAEKLITQDKVATLFGCWTSASRKMVKPVVERHNHLLFYPVQYEGLEQSPNIVYVGAAPNQQIIPAIKWCSSQKNKKKRFFVVGSDYVFPRAASAIMRDQANVLGAEIVGEEYVPLASTDMAAVVKKIQERKPDMILNTINGDSNVAFFRAMRKAGLTSDAMPIMSFSISEEELSSLGPKEMQGNYAAWNYFQSIDLPENQDFVARFRARFGERIVSDPMEAAYVGVHLWAQAVAAAGSDDVAAIRGAIHEQSFQAPEGKVTIDPQNHHVSKFIRIGKITEAGSFEVVYCSDAPIKPIPYPATRPRAEWDALLTDLHLLWDGWENPNQ